MIGWRALPAALLLLLSGAAIAAPPVLPPYAGAYQPQGVDERGIWMLADEDERALRDSQSLVRDPALDGYLRDVLCRTVGADRCAGVRMYVVRVPAFNASMTPNGAMQLWTGMLLRVRNEAELAAILGHEYAHFEQRHSLLDYRRRRMASDIASWAGLLGSSGLLVQHAAVGSVYAYSRDQEKAADMLGFTYLAAAQYRTACFSDVWVRIMDEADATAVGRKRRSQRYDRVAFFASHPTSLDRANYLRAIAGPDGESGTDGAARYRAALGPWRAEFLADQLKLNDFEGTEYLLTRLAQEGWTPDLLFARAELYRMRGHPRDLAAAAGFYQDAIAAGSTDPQVRRGLGMALLRSGDAAGGQAALQAYLRLQPDAKDRAMIESLVQ